MIQVSMNTLSYALLHNEPRCTILYELNGLLMGRQNEPLGSERRKGNGIENENENEPSAGGSERSSLVYCAR